jgi:hypothetical protein
MGLVTRCAEAAASHRRPLCVVYRCRTLDADAQARVFRATKLRQGDLIFSGTFAQSAANQRITPLGDQYVHEEPTLSLTHPALAGNWVAYGLIRSGKYNGEGAVFNVRRLNAMTGRREEARASACVGGLPFMSPGVTDMAVVPSGAAAWIIGEKEFDQFSSNPSPSPAIYRVCELPSGSTAPLQLASGAAIQPKSLAAIPGQVYWKEQGLAHSAPLR